MLKMRKKDGISQDDITMSRLEVTSRKSILYALRELGRRAGASTESIARWSVQFLVDRVILYPEAGPMVRVIFPIDLSKPSRFAELRDVPARRYEWMLPPP